MQEYARNEAIPPTHRHAGSDSERQRVGLPGHCKECAAIGHLAAHPDLGCGDVGCGNAHDDDSSHDGGTLLPVAELRDGDEIDWAGQRVVVSAVVHDGEKASFDMTGPHLTDAGRHYRALPHRSPGNGKARTVTLYHRAEPAAAALLRAFTALATAADQAASDLLGDRTLAAKLTRAGLLAQRATYMRAHRLVTVALRPGSGDLPFALTELLTGLVGTDAAREAVAGLQ